MQSVDLAEQVYHDLEGDGACGDTAKHMEEARDAAEREASRLSQELQRLQGRLEVLSSQSNDGSLTRTQTTMERITCPICIEPMVDATTLSCGHSGCFGCLQANRARNIRCPTCRAPNFGPVNVNVTLRDHIERLFSDSRERVTQITEMRLAQAEQLRSARQFDAARDLFQRAAGSAPASQRDSILAQIETLPTEDNDSDFERASSAHSTGSVSDSDDGSALDSRDLRDLRAAIADAWESPWVNDTDSDSDNDSDNDDETGHDRRRLLDRLTEQADLGNERRVALVLRDEGVDINAEDTDGTTALIQAAARGHEDVVALLLDHPDIDVNHARVADGVTALINAAAEGEVEIVEQLLAADAKIDSADNEGDTALFVAANNGDESIVSLLCKKIVESGRREFLNQLSGPNRDITPLMCASSEGCVQALVDAGAQLEAVDSGGLTALMMAVLQAECDVISTLISAGASLHARAWSFHGQSALHLAVIRGNLQCLELLISEGADVNVQDDYGCSALFQAARAGRADLASCLLSNRADPNLKDVRQQSPLLVAMHSGAHGAREVEQLLRNAGCTASDYSAPSSPRSSVADDRYLETEVAPRVQVCPHLRKVKKKLAQIEELKAKQATGVDLDEQQLTKLAQEADLRAQKSLLERQAALAA